MGAPFATFFSFHRYKIVRTDLLPREQYFSLVYWYQLYEKLIEYLKEYPEDVFVAHFVAFLRENSVGELSVWGERDDKAFSTMGTTPQKMDQVLDEVIHTPALKDYTYEKDAETDFDWDTPFYGISLYKDNWGKVRNRKFWNYFCPWIGFLTHYHGSEKRLCFSTWLWLDEEFASYVIKGNKTRLAEMERQVRGAVYREDDPGWTVCQELTSGNARFGSFESQKEYLVSESVNALVDFEKVFVPFLTTQFTTYMEMG